MIFEGFLVHWQVYLSGVVNFGISVSVSLILVSHIYSLSVFNFVITIFYFQRPFIISHFSSKGECSHQQPTGVLFYSLHRFGLIFITMALLYPFVAPTTLCFYRSYKRLFGVCPRVLVLPCYLEAVHVWALSLVLPSSFPRVVHIVMSSEAIWHCYPQAAFNLYL